MVYRTLFACYASKGRSAGLCAYFNSLAMDNGASHLEADSAGVGKEVIEYLRKIGNDGADSTIKRILHEDGIHTIDKHRIKHISELDYTPDLILPVDRTVLMSLWDFGCPLQLAKAYAGLGDGDIVDAYKLNLEKGSPEHGRAYKRMAAELKDVATRVFERVLRETSSQHHSS